VLGLGVLAVALQAVTVPLLLATRPVPPVADAVFRSLRVAQIGPGKPYGIAFGDRLDRKLSLSR
jgi:hypothetical protein